MSISEFKAQPKEIKEKYRGQEIVITYDPDAKLWRWFFDMTVVTPFTGEQITINKAMREAKRMVDLVNGKV